MKAAVDGGPGCLELRDWPDPVAQAGELLVRVRGCGLRGSELREAFDLLATGKVRVDGLITHRLPLGQLAQGVELMRRHEAVKVCITP